MIRNFPNWKFVRWSFTVCELSAQLQEQRGGQGQLVLGSSSLPFSALLRLSWEFSQKIEIQIRPLQEYINRFQIHECRNGEQGCAVSFRRMYVLNFWYSVWDRR
jgi:hypothetical protein